MKRTWKYVTGCCKPAGTLEPHDASEPLIICQHGIPLRPVDQLDRAFIDSFMRERREFVDHYRSRRDSFTFGQHGEIPLKAGLLELAPE